MSQTASIPQVPQLDRVESHKSRMPRLPWSEHDIDLLHSLCGQQIADGEIAERLGRTERAVRTMILRQGGKHLREAPRPWSGAELETIVRLNAAGVTCADIATHLGDRTQLAVFRKLCRLVGPAPSAVAKRSRTAIKPTRAPEAPTAKMLCFPTPVVPPQPIPATIDAMVRWLRSRDYIVLRKSEGWQIDQHHLSDICAVVEFVNVRRARLRMPPFVLQEPEPMPIAAIVFHTERRRRWAHGGRNR